MKSRKDAPLSRRVSFLIEFKDWEALLLIAEREYQSSGYVIRKYVREGLAKDAKRAIK